MGYSNLNLAVQSNALSNTDGLGCVLSLDLHTSGATTGQGSTSVVLNGCSLYDNSDSTTALTVGGSAQITALSVGVVGNLTGASNITTTQGIKTGIGAVADPYANASFPAFSGCTTQNFTAKDTVTIGPGVYCGGMKMNAGANVTLNAGIYYFDGGDLTVNGGATMTGSDVTLVFTSQNRNGFGTVQINGNATISLTAPKTGATAGIVVFGDRRIPTGTAFKFNGWGNSILWRRHLCSVRRRKFLRRRKYRHKLHTTDRKHGKIYRQFRIRAELQQLRHQALQSAGGEADLIRLPSPGWRS